MWHFTTPSHSVPLTRLAWNLQGGAVRELQSRAQVGSVTGSVRSLPRPSALLFAHVEA